MEIYLKNCFYALICTKFDYIAPVSSLGYQQIIFLLLVETELHASLPTKFSQHPWKNFGIWRSEVLHSSWMIKTFRKKVAPNAVDQLKLATWQKNVQQRPIRNSIFRPKAHDLSLLLPAQLGYCKIITLFPSLQCQCTTNRQDHIFTFIPGVTGQPGDIFSEQKKNLAYITSYLCMTDIVMTSYICMYIYILLSKCRYKKWAVYAFCLVNLFNVGHNTKVSNIYLQILLLIQTYQVRK